MKLYLVQHGEAVVKEIDAERPLTETGTADVTRVANSLALAGISVARVIHSGKTRARQTAEILAAAVAPSIQPEVSNLINPNDDPTELDLGAGDTMIVGHLPFMGRLVSLLVAGNADSATVSYAPGSVVCLESDGDGGWQINWMLQPSLVE